MLVGEPAEGDHELHRDTEVPVIAEAGTGTPVVPAHAAVFPERAEDPMVAIVQLDDSLLDLVEAPFELVDAVVDSVFEIATTLFPHLHLGVDVVLQTGDVTSRLLPDLRRQHLHEDLEGLLPSADRGQLIQPAPDLIQGQILAFVGLADHTQATGPVFAGTVASLGSDLGLHLGLGGGGRGGGSGDDAETQQGGGDEQHALDHDGCSFRASSHGRHARWVNSGSAAVGFGF